MSLATYIRMRVMRSLQKRLKWRKHFPPISSLACFFLAWQMFGLERASAAAPYGWTELQFVDNINFVHADKISDDGRVAGVMYLQTPSAPFAVATVWDQGGSPNVLSVDAPYQQAVAQGFNGQNALGLIVPVGNSGGPPTEWRAGGPVALPIPFSYGAAVDGNGTVIVGMSIINTADPEFSYQNASLWENDQLRRLNIDWADHSQIRSINAEGTYVGMTTNRSFQTVDGFIGKDGTAVRLSHPDFPRLTPWRINDAGWISGRYVSAQDGRVRAFLASPGAEAFYDLGLFGDYTEVLMRGMDNDNTVVGGARYVGTDLQRALIWPEGSLVAQDLNAYANIPGITLIEATDINDAGQILAVGYAPASGLFSYYVLTPVPEPAAAAVAGGWLLFMARRGAGGGGSQRLRRSISADRAAFIAAISASAGLYFGSAEAWAKRFQTGLVGSGSSRWRGKMCQCMCRTRLPSMSWLSLTGLNAFQTASVTIENSARNFARRAGGMSCSSAMQSLVTTSV